MAASRTDGAVQDMTVTCVRGGGEWCGTVSVMQEAGQGQDYATNNGVEEPAGMVARESNARREQVRELYDRVDGVEKRMASMDSKPDKIVDAVTRLPQRVEKLERAVFSSRK